MKLRELLTFDNIVIQCHDNPDADAIGSGFGLYKYFMNNGKNVIFAYSGNFLIKKSNLVIMIEELGIPIVYAKNTNEVLKALYKDKAYSGIGLLITVDSQYGQGNLSVFSCENIATIDHHQVSGTLPVLNEVRSNQGSCSTVVWDMMLKEGYDFDDDEELSTALYYGLMTDTNNFAELHHPLDRDMQDSLKIRISAITKFRNSNISKEELSIAGDALKHATFLDKYKSAIVSVKPCDPNILGIISDMSLEVDSLDTCLAYSVLESGVKISVRSCSREVKANEMADYISEGIGNGGGHIIKAGGLLQKELIEKRGIKYAPKEIGNYLNERLVSYFEGTEIIDCTKFVADISDMKRYKKKNLRVGYVVASEIAPIGTEISIRTLEGDVNIDVSEDMYIMIGIKGEIYPIKQSKFESGYVPVDDVYSIPSGYNVNGGYKPVVKNLTDGSSIDFFSLAKSCVVTGGNLIYAKEIDHCVKVFTLWDYDSYYLGKPGDFLVVREDDLSDAYIAERQIFFDSYDLVE